MLAPLASIFFTIGWVLLATCFIASAAVAVTAELVRRYEEREKRRRFELHAEKELRDHLRVIGGNSVSSHERWGRAA